MVVMMQALHAEGYFCRKPDPKRTGQRLKGRQTVDGVCTENILARSPE